MVRFWKLLVKLGFKWDMKLCVSAWSQIIPCEGPWQIINIWQRGNENGPNIIYIITNKIVFSVKYSTAYRVSVIEPSSITDTRSQCFFSEILPELELVAEVQSESLTEVNWIALNYLYLFAHVSYGGGGGSAAAAALYLLLYLFLHSFSSNCFWSTQMHTVHFMASFLLPLYLETSTLVQQVMFCFVIFLTKTDHGGGHPSWAVFHSLSIGWGPVKAPHNNTPT